MSVYQYSEDSFLDFLFRNGFSREVTGMSVSGCVSNGECVVEGQLSFPSGGVSTLNQNGLHNDDIGEGSNMNDEAGDYYVRAGKQNT